MENINKSAGKAEGGDSRQIYLTFMVSGQQYGIPISCVLEIMKLRQSANVPDMPDHAKGVISLRGRVVPLIDAGIRFGMEEKEYTDRACIIIVDVEGHLAGLIVDIVSDVVPIGDDRVSAPPSFFKEGGGGCIISVAKLEKGMVLLLDVRRLITKTT